MLNTEIERKFLIDPSNIPYDIKTLTCLNIVQGYMPSEATLRLRKVNENKFFQTIKSKGTKIRDEYEIELTEFQFNVLWNLCKDITVSKNRYLIPTEHGLLEIDEYFGNLSGLWTLEIEFKTLEDCDNYKPLDWFGEEVTENIEYKNSQLAINGLTKKLI